MGRRAEDTRALGWEPPTEPKCTRTLWVRKRSDKGLLTHGALSFLNAALCICGLHVESPTGVDQALGRTRIDTRRHPRMRAATAVETAAVRGSERPAFAPRKQGPNGRFCVDPVQRPYSYGVLRIAY